MKTIAMVLAALLLVLSVSLATAQQLPDIDVFSPGLLRLSSKMADDPAVHMEAELSAVDAFHVRDLSVFSAMLKGATLIYDGCQSGDGEYADMLRIEREGQTLFSGAMDGSSVTVNGELFSFSPQEITGMGEKEAALIEFVQNTAILERAPLEKVESFLLSLVQGEELLFGYRVETPFESERTMSDDGTRLTRISITGSIAKEGEAPWVIKGYLRQPAGRAPKDTFELTAVQDEKNSLELTYSSLRKKEITQKNRAGKVSVDTHLKIAGKLGGYSINERVTSYLRNTWTADGENLSEKISASLTLEHHDSTPGREMQRMNKAEAKMRHDIRLTTAESGSDVIDLTDAITLSLAMDGYTVLDAAAQTAMRIGGEAAQMTQADEAQPGRTLAAALDDAAKNAARVLYGQLDSAAKKKVLTGLDESLQ
ncbi:MAG: hypothetical protein IKU34_10470 [Clostridia bacterium]|nr:hypothetical protein [Clostridia bacterium]